MPRFRKKPFEIEAHRWFKNGDHPDDGNECFTTGPFTGEKYEGHVVRYYRHPEKSGDHICWMCRTRMHEHGWIDTPEGGFTVCPGDWIITGIAGERCPCKPDIFEQTYEPASPAGSD